MYEEQAERHLLKKSIPKRVSLGFAIQDTQGHVSISNPKLAHGVSYTTTSARSRSVGGSEAIWRYEGNK